MLRSPAIALVPPPGAAMAARDTKRPEAGAHVVSRTAFSAFLADAKAGRFDLGPAGTR